MNKIILNENQLKRLFEYHAQQRLPFDEVFYGKKNQAEQYLDWLEEFGKYGTIGNSSLNFQECVENGIEAAVKRKRITGMKYDNYIDEISDILNQKFKYIQYDDRGNIYVERAINIEHNINTVVNDLFSSLSDKYHNNVGGCWAFKPGMGIAYCTEANGALILLKGYIRLEEIDWLKTCDLNYNQDEYEIRVKPNAKVELFEVLVNGKYKLPLQGTLIVSSTYFGNRQGYEKDLATVDDGMGGKRLINRQGEYVCGNYEVRKSLGDGFYEIINPNEYNRNANIFDSNKNVIISKKWFDGCFYDKNNQQFIIENDGLYNFMDLNGNLLLDDFYSTVRNLNKYIYLFISKTNCDVYINDGGVYKLLFRSMYDNIRYLSIDRNDCFLVKKDGKYNIIDVNEKQLFNNWYDSIDERYNFSEIMFYVKLDGKANFIDINEKPLLKVWYDDVFTLVDGYFLVKEEKKNNIIDSNSRYISDEWFDDFELVDFYNPNRDLYMLINNQQNDYSYNILKLSMGKLSPIWFKSCRNASKLFNTNNGLAYFVGIGEDFKPYIFDENGTFYIKISDDNEIMPKGKTPIPCTNN